MERPQNTMELATGPETLTFPKIPSNADSMALAVKGNTDSIFFHILIFFSDLLDGCSSNDTFSMSNVFLNLVQANGHAENIYPVELGRAQGYLYAYCQLK